MSAQQTHTMMKSPRLVLAILDSSRILVSALPLAMLMKSIQMVSASARKDTISLAIHAEFALPLKHTTLFIESAALNAKLMRSGIQLLEPADAFLGST